MEQRLKENEIDELIALHKSLKKKNDADKIKCLILWGKGWSWLQIKEALLISDHYISNIIKDFKTGKIKKVLKNNYTGNNSKMTKAQEKELCNYLDNNFILNAKVVCKYVKESFGLEYTQKGMVQTLKRLGFTFKKPKLIPGKCPDKKTQKEFADKLDNTFDNLKENEAGYYVDGSGIVHNMKLNHGWIRKGKNKYIKTNTGRKKMNINGAYNPLTQETICIEQEGSVSVNQESNIELVKKIIRLHPELKLIYLIMDNAKTNKGKLFMKYIKDLYELKNIKIEIIYTPPYSPNLNLIERLWKYSKNILLKDYIEKYTDFKEKIINFFEIEIKEEKHREKLKTFIGRKFQIIDAPT
jgi:transposase